MQNNMIDTLFLSVKDIIDNARKNVAIAVNSTMSLLYWEVGKYVNSYILENQRAEYGKQIVASLARQLQQDYGNNFSEKNLRRMMQFADRFPEKEKVVSLIRQLTWTHVIALIPIEDKCIWKIVTSGLQNTSQNCQRRKSWRTGCKRQ